MLGVLSVCVYHLSPTCRINNTPYLHTANYLLGYNSFYYKITQNHNNYILTEMNEFYEYLIGLCFATFAIECIFIS